MLAFLISTGSLYTLLPTRAKVVLVHLHVRLDIPSDCHRWRKVAAKLLMAISAIVFALPGCCLTNFYTSPDLLRSYSLAQLLEHNFEKHCSLQFNLAVGPLSCLQQHLALLCNHVATFLSLQLFDRNSQRSFAPVAAFQADMPASFIRDMQSASVAAEGPQQWSNPRVAAVLK